MLLVILWAGSAQVPLSFFQLGPLGPFTAVTLVEQTTWASSKLVLASLVSDYGDTMTDSLFGRSVHHFPVQISIDLILACWFLLAVTRNIKRDPNKYEVYSPAQSLGFALFLNLLFLAFFRWRGATLFDSQSFLLTLNMMIFMCLGLAMLRNRERARRILRAREGAGESWLDLLWPAPLLILGTLVAGFLIVAAATRERDPHLDWNVSMAVFRSVFFVAWLVRDVQYLQWMSMQRGKHSLAMGALYQVIFYACVTASLAAFGFFNQVQRVPFTAFFLPTPVYLLDHAAWALRPVVWGAAFAAQWLLTIVFLLLQRQVIGEMTSRKTPPLPADALV